jgi:hypothetical protein
VSPPVTPVGGQPVNQFGTPVNQFGTPTTEFGGPVAPPPVGWAPYPTGPAPRPTRYFWIVGAAAGVVVIAIVAAVLVFLHNRHTLSLPQTADGYSLVTDPRLQQISNSVVNELNDSGGNHAIVGYYGTNNVPAVAVIAARSAGSPADKLSHTEEGLQQTAGLSSAMTDEPAGKLGGDMQCGAITVSGHSLPVCGWADSDTLGVVVLFDSDAAAAPSTALTFRQAVEH